MIGSGRSAALYLLLTFVSGAAVGVLGQRMYASRAASAAPRQARSESFRQRYLNEMQTRLNLRPDQREKLVTVLDGTRTLFRELSEKHRPEYDAIHQHQVEQISAFLDPGQRTEYAKVVREQKERRERHNSGKQ